MNTELRRYVAYLQAQLLTEGSEAIHDPQIAINWVRKNRARHVAIAKAAGVSIDAVDLMEVELDQHSASSSFDSGFSSAIFRPVLDSVLSAAHELGLRPKRTIVLANSTDISFTPVSRPSEGEHLIFAGAGTSVFCNYWAKIIALVARQFHAHFGNSTMTLELLAESCARDHRIFVEACKLVFFCRLNKTAVAFGSLSPTPESSPYRVELLYAMESFAIAHEVGHCFLEERSPGSSDAHSEDEYTCDAYALAVTRRLGNARNNWSAFAGAGGVLFFLLTDLCQEDPAPHESQPTTHPPSSARLQSLERLAVQHLDDDERSRVLSYLGELHVLCEMVRTLVEAAGDVRE